MAGITEADKRPRGYSTKIQIILVYIFTGSRSRRVYASLDVYKAQQTSFLTFLVEVHDLVVCFVQNRFLNSEARRGALSMTYSCEVRGKTSPKLSQHCKVSSFVERPLLPWRVTSFPINILLHKSQKWKKHMFGVICSNKNRTPFLHSFPLHDPAHVFKTVLVPFSSNFIFLLKSSAEEFF